MTRATTLEPSPPPPPALPAEPPSEESPLEPPSECSCTIAEAGFRVTRLDNFYVSGPKVTGYNFEGVAVKA